MIVVVLVVVAGLLLSALIVASVSYAIEVEAREEAERDGCEGDWPFIPAVNSPVHVEVDAK